MYTLDYIKSLHIDLETWNNGLETLIDKKIALFFEFFRKSVYIMFIKL